MDIRVDMSLGVAPTVMSKHCRGSRGRKQGIHLHSRGRRLRKAYESVRDNAGKTGGRRQVREFARIEPARLIEFLIEDRLTLAPAGGKAQDDEVPFHPAFRIAHDGFPKAGERDRLDRYPRLLAHFTRYCFLERLSHLDYPAGQAVEAMGWRTRAAHHK